MKKCRDFFKTGWFRVKNALQDEQGISTIELILVLVGIFTPYYTVGIACIE